MKICYSWLSNYVEHGLSSRDLALTLTMAGFEVEGILPYDGDWVLDVNVPPNRPDCLSHLGLARDLGNLLKKKVTYPISRVAEKGQNIREFITVKLAEKKLCPRYTGRVIEDVIVRPSPDWLKRRIESVGVRSINNVVDVTNFVLMESGHPLHAFDLDLLEDRTIIIRRGKKDESFTTLDGNLRVADQSSLLICDGKKPVALAGIMGGANSEVRPETHRIFLESAYFDPITIRRTSRKLFLSTESSYRFERGTDPYGLVPALDRAASLISEVSGGKVARGIVEASSRIPKRPVISLTLEYSNRLLGTTLSETQVEKCISLPGYDVRKRKKDVRRGKGLSRAEWGVRPPSWRIDISRQEDLIEEIARLTGYDKIHVAMPLVPLSTQMKVRGWDVTRQARDLLRRIGYHEAITYSFISRKSLEVLKVGQAIAPDKVNTAGPDEDFGERLGHVLPLRNPLTEEQSIMRTSLIPGLLQALALNIRRRNLSVKLFEIGRVFWAVDKEKPPVEKVMLGIVAVGARMEEVWNVPHDEVDYFDIKGALEYLLNGLGVVSFRVRPAPDIPYLHPGTSTHIIVDGMNIGVLGRVHEDVSRALEIKVFPYVCEIDFDAILRIPPRKVQFVPLSKFPGSLRDIAILLDESVPAEKALDSITSIRDEIIKDIMLFDVYTGGNIPPGKKSLAFRIHFSAEERTITDSEVNVIFDKIISQIEHDLGATIRKQTSS